MVAISVVLAFLFFISVDMLILKLNGKVHPAFEKDTSETGSIIFNTNIEIPKEILISEGHTWIKKLSRGLIQIGIDNFIQPYLKNIHASESIKPGKELKKGEIIIEGSIGNKNIKFLSPIDGIIKSLNYSRKENKARDPYLDWQLMIQPENSIEQNSFLSGSKAVSWMKEEFLKLEDFLTAHSGQTDLAGVTMYDGGKPVENKVESIIENNIEEFQDKFITK